MKLLLTTIAVFGIACLGAMARTVCDCREPDIDPDAARSRACDSLAGLREEPFPAGIIRCARVLICDTQCDPDHIISGCGPVEGFSCCNGLLEGPSDRPVNRLGRTNSFPCEVDRPCTYALFSPGVPGMSPYRENLACRGRMECGPDRYIYYLMFSHGLSSDEDEDGQCKDFLDIEFMSYGRIPQTCGNYENLVEEVPFFQGIERKAIETHFHSNSIADNSTGFYLITVCFVPTLEEEEECFKPVPNDITGGRRKRETDDYVEDIFNKMMERDSRDKRSGVRFRSPKIKVPDGATLSYKDGVIRVFIGNKWLYKFEGIRVLQTFNMIEGYLTHYGSADGTFLGCGFLRVGDQIAHFIQMPVDFALYPTREEISIIVTYLNALYPSLLLDNNSTDIPRGDRVNPQFPVEPQFFPGIPPLDGFPGFYGLPGFPSRSPTASPSPTPRPTPSPSPRPTPIGAPGQTGSEDPQDFLDDVALRFLVRACNPILRQVGCDYLRDRNIRLKSEEVTMALERYCN